MEIRFLMLGCVAALMPFVTSAQTILTEGTNISADASASNGRIAFDLLGGIWIIPASGGQAKELPNTVLPARSPRWSPSAKQLLYQAVSPDGSRLWLHDMQSNIPVPLTSGKTSDQHASWHPDGERVVF